MLAPLSGKGQNDICSPGRKRVIDIPIFGAQGTCLVAAKCRPISSERDLTIKANVVLAECTICYSVIVYLNST